MGRIPEDIDYKGLAALLEGSRRSRKKTLREAADVIGVKSSTLSRIERGEVRPSFRTVQAVADWIGIPLQRVLRRSGRGQRFRRQSPPVENIELQLRADPDLSPQAAEALIRIFKAAYEELATKKKPEA